MIARIFTYVILYVALNQSTNAQYLSLEFGNGIATYNMSDLKTLNENIKMNMPVKTKTVNNFPPFLYYKMNAQWDIRKIAFGVSLTHYSTGSRIHYSDYSGSISVKQMIKGNSVSFPFKVNLSHKERTDFYILFEPGFSMTQDRIENQFKVGDEIQNDIFTVESESFCFTSGISCSYYFRRFRFSSTLGYLIDAGGKLHVPGDSRMELIDDYGKSIKTNLSGLRFEITAGIRLKSRFRIKEARVPAEKSRTKFWDWFLNSDPWHYNPSPVRRPF